MTVCSASATPLPVPGAALATVVQDPHRVPCQSFAPDVARALAAWDAELAQLPQMAVSILSVEELLPSLDRAARDAREHHLRRAVALAPARTNIRGQLVQTLIVQKRFDEADGELDEALRYVVSPCHAGVLWRKLGYEKALKAYTPPPSTSKMTVKVCR